MKKRIISAFLIIALMLCVIPAAAEADEGIYTEDFVALGMAEDIAELKARGTLKIGILDVDQLGFYMEDEAGNLSGFDIDIAKNIAQALDLKPEFIRVDGGYDGLFQAVVKGDVDIIISTFSHTIERLEYIDFSAPYLTTNYATVVNKAAMVRTGIGTNPIPYMREHTVDIALQGGTAHTPRVKSLFPKANIIEVETAEEAFLMVTRDEAFATLSSEAELFLYGLMNPSAGIYTSGFSFTDVNDEFCVGINRKYPHLKDIIDLYISTNKLMTEDEIESWFYEYFTTEK